MQNVRKMDVKVVGLFFVATTRINLSPSFALELLQRIARVIKDYLGILNEESLRKNFVLVIDAARLPNLGPAAPFTQGNKRMPNYGYCSSGTGAVILDDCNFHESVHMDSCDVPFMNFTYHQKKADSPNSGKETYDEIDAESMLGFIDISGLKPETFTEELEFASKIDIEPENVMYVGVESPNYEMLIQESDSYEYVTIEIIECGFKSNQNALWISFRQDMFEYQEGNIEAALHVFKGIDIAAVITKKLYSGVFDLGENGSRKILPPWGDLADQDFQGRNNLDNHLDMSIRTVDEAEDGLYFLEEKVEEILSNRILKLSRSNKVRSALTLYPINEAFGLLPNSHACNSLLSCLLRNKRIDDALKIFEFMKSNEIVTGHSYSLILKAVTNVRSRYAMPKDVLPKRELKGSQIQEMAEAFRNMTYKNSIEFFAEAFLDDK